MLEVRKKALRKISLRVGKETMKDASTKGKNDGDEIEVPESPKKGKSKKGLKSPKNKGKSKDKMTESDNKTKSNKSNKSTMTRIRHKIKKSFSKKSKGSWQSPKSKFNASADLPSPTRFNSSLSVASKQPKLEEPSSFLETVTEKSILNTSSSGGSNLEVSSNIVTSPPTELTDKSGSNDSDDPTHSKSQQTQPTTDLPQALTDETSLNSSGPFDKPSTMLKERADESILTCPPVEGSNSVEEVLEISNSPLNTVSLCSPKIGDGAGSQASIEHSDASSVFVAKDHAKSITSVNDSEKVVIDQVGIHEKNTVKDDKDHTKSITSGNDSEKVVIDQVDIQETNTVKDDTDHTKSITSGNDSEKVVIDQVEIQETNTVKDDTDHTKSITSGNGSEKVVIDQVEIQETNTVKDDTSCTLIDQVLDEEVVLPPASNYNDDEDTDEFFKLYSNLDECSDVKQTWFRFLMVCCLSGIEGHKEGLLTLQDHKKGLIIDEDNFDNLITDDESMESENLTKE